MVTFDVKIIKHHFLLIHKSCLSSMMTFIVLWLLNSKTSSHLCLILSHMCSLTNWSGSLRTKYSKNEVVWQFLIGNWWFGGNKDQIAFLCTSTSSWNETKFLWQSKNGFWLSFAFAILIAKNCFRFCVWEIGE